MRLDQVRVALTLVANNSYIANFNEIREVLARSCSEIAHSCSLRTRVAREPTDVFAGAEGAGVHVLMGNSAFVAPNILPFLEHRDFVLHQVEPLGPGAPVLQAFPRYLEILRRARHVWDYSTTNIAFLRTLGIKRASHVPFCWHPCLDRIPPAPEKDIDVLFYGMINRRRARVRDALLARGLRVEFRQKIYGAERDDLISRARIVLNLHHFDGFSILEEARVSYLLANRCFVISETADVNPYAGGMIFADLDDLPEVCARWLAAGAEARAEVAEKGHAALRRRPLAPFIRDALTRTLTTDAPPPLTPTASPSGGSR